MYGIRNNEGRVRRRRQKRENIYVQGVQLKETETLQKDIHTHNVRLNYNHPTYALNNLTFSAATLKVAPEGSIFLLVMRMRFVVPVYRSSRVTYKV